MDSTGTTGVLVDSCVLLDVITADPQWQQWTTEQPQAVPAGTACGDRLAVFWESGLHL